MHRRGSSWRAPLPPVARCWVRQVSSLRGTLTINNAQPPVLPALGSHESTVQCLGAYGGCRDRLLLMIKSSPTMQGHRLWMDWAGPGVPPHASSTFTSDPASPGARPSSFYSAPGTAPHHPSRGTTTPRVPEGGWAHVGASPWGTELCQAASRRWSHPRREQVTRSVFRDVGVSLQSKGCLAGFPVGPLAPS